MVLKRIMLGLFGVFLLFFLTRGVFAQDNVEFTGNMSILGTSLTVDGVEVCLEDGTNCPGNLTGTNITYGEMFRHDPGFIVGIAAQDVWTNITDLQGGQLNGFTFDNNNTLTALQGGTYAVDYSISFSGGASDNYRISVTINGIEQNQTESHRRLNAGGDLDNVGGTGIVQIATDDELRLIVKNLNDADNLNYTNVNLRLVELAPIRILTESWDVAVMLGLISLSFLFFYFGQRTYETNKDFLPIKLVSFMMGGLTLWTSVYVGSVITASESTEISSIVLRVWTGLTYVGTFILFLILIFFIVRILKNFKLQKNQRIEGNET